MSNAAAAYYAYLAHETRQRATLFRKFGYCASADHLDRRADRYDRKSANEERAPAGALVPGVEHEEGLATHTRAPEVEEKQKALL